MMDLAAQAGCIFTREAGSLVADDDYRWFEAIEGFASDVVRYLTRTLIDRAEMHRLAAQNIAKHRISRVPLNPFLIAAQRARHLTVSGLLPVQFRTQQHGEKSP